MALTAPYFFSLCLTPANPPYQVEDGGSKASAKPVYQYFVDNAIKISPNYICVITPTRWFAGGKGLNDFRDSMLNDTHIRELHDWLSPDSLFPNTNIRGGVCYFLWEKNYDNKKNLAVVVTHDKNNNIHTAKRHLKIPEADIFIRHEQAIFILKKVKALAEETMDKWLSPRKPFGIESSFSKSNKFYNSKNTNRTILCIAKGMKKGYISRSDVVTHKEWISSWKVYVPRANNIGTELSDDNLNAFIGEPGSVCTEAYIAIGIDRLHDTLEADDLVRYLKTKFARFMHSLAKASQDATAKTYSLVPIQDFTPSSDIDWSKSIHEIDLQLYQKYGLNEEEVDFIEKNVKEMA